MDRSVLMTMKFPSRVVSATEVIFGRVFLVGVDCLLVDAGA